MERHHLLVLCLDFASDEFEKELLQGLCKDLLIELRNMIVQLVTEGQRQEPPLKYSLMTIDRAAKPEVSLFLESFCSVDSKIVSFRCEAISKRLSSSPYLRC